MFGWAKNQRFHRVPWCLRAPEISVPGFLEGWRCAMRVQLHGPLFRLRTDLVGCPSSRSAVEGMCFHPIPCNKTILLNRFNHSEPGFRRDVTAAAILWANASSICKDRCTTDPETRCPLRNAVCGEFGWYKPLRTLNAGCVLLAARGDPPACALRRKRPPHVPGSASAVTFRSGSTILRYSPHHSSLATAHPHEAEMCPGYLAVSRREGTMLRRSSRDKSFRQFEHAGDVEHLDFRVQQSAEHA